MNKFLLLNIFPTAIQHLSHPCHHLSSCAVLTTGRAIIPHFDFLLIAINYFTRIGWRVDNGSKLGVDLLLYQQQQQQSSQSQSQSQLQSSVNSRVKRVHSMFGVKLKHSSLTSHEITAMIRLMRTAKKVIKHKTQHE